MHFGKFLICPTKCVSCVGNICTVGAKLYAEWMLNGCILGYKCAGYVHGLYVRCNGCM